MAAIKSKIAHVDLNSGAVGLEVVDPEIVAKFGGGSGLAALRLLQELPAGLDPLAPEAVIWVTGGPLTGTSAPSSGRLEVVNKSAVNGLMGHSNTGGKLGSRIKNAGLDGLAIRGRAREPIYLLITNDGVSIRPAGHFWGKGIFATEQAIGAELGDPDVKRIKVMAIGPAGENLVRFACPINERWHAAARGGSGAVFGSKLLKAIVVDTSPSRIYVSEEFKKVTREAFRKVQSDPTCQKYRSFGSSAVSDYWADMGCFPGKNYREGCPADWKETRGTRAMKSLVVGPQGACFNCPMPCFNRVEVNSGRYSGLGVSSGTFVQTVLDFGAKCYLASLPAIYRCKELCHDLGMDMDSASGVIAFALELKERGLLPEELDPGEHFCWGDEDCVHRLLTDIAYRRGLGDVLADGSAIASLSLGPATKPYVMAIKGMEMISSDVRRAPRGWSLGSLTNSRGGDNLPGTHMKGDSLPDLDLIKPENREAWEEVSRQFVDHIDMFPEVKKEIYGDPPLVDPFTYRGKARMVVWFEDLLNAVDAVGTCTFPADKLAIGPTHFARMLSAYLECNITPKDFMLIGERIINVHRLFVAREGIGRIDDIWPNRFFEEDLSPNGSRVDRVDVERFLDDYYRIRGWDPVSGHPTKETLKRLEMEDLTGTLG